MASLAFANLDRLGIPNGTALQARNWGLVARDRSNLSSVPVLESQTVTAGAASFTALPANANVLFTGAGRELHQVTGA
jgi:hypothetical protein